MGVGTDAKLGLTSRIEEISANAGKVIALLDEIIGTRPEAHPEEKAIEPCVIGFIYTRLAVLNGQVQYISEQVSAIHKSL